VVAWHYVPGRLFPVNSRSVLREPGLFSKNERLVTLIEGPAGLTAVIMVAAVGVGHITVSYDPDVATHGDRFGSTAPRRQRLTSPVPIQRGQELGIFNLGSTTIVIGQQNRMLLDSLAPGATVRMGQAIGRILDRRAQG
jgi:phosphatidylserine decarboxylase